MSAPTVAVTPEYGEQLTTDNRLNVGGQIYWEIINSSGVAVGDPLLCVASSALDVGRVYIVDDIPGTFPTRFGLRNLQGNRVTVGTGAFTDVFAFTDLIDDDNDYIVSAVDASGVETPSAASGSVRNNLNNAGASNTISWDAVEGAASYRVYKKQTGTGLFGYIGVTEDTSFVDSNIAPDLSDTAPRQDEDIAQPTNYSRASARFEQRRCFAGSDLFPRRLFMSRSGTEVDFSSRLPVVDDDRISIEVAAREAHVIRHIVPMTDLLLLTQLGEWRVFAINSDAITPTTIAVRPQSFVGSSTVRPQIVNNSVLFCAARGGHVRELGFQATQQGFVTGDLSLRATHLFDDFEITSSAQSKAPVPVVWFVSTSGKLLGLTYIPEEQLGAWHQHDTDGVIESVTSIPDGEEDRVYVTVARQITGSTVRKVERMAPIQVGRVMDSSSLDAAQRFDGIRTGSVTITGGLFEGDTVTVTSDQTTTFSIQDVGKTVVAGAGGARVLITSFFGRNSVIGRLLQDLKVDERSTPITPFTVAAQTITGLSLLEGKDVSVVYEPDPSGKVLIESHTVTNGAVTLAEAAMRADVGIRYDCDIRTLPMTLQMEAAGYGRTKSVNHVWLRVYEAAGLSVGTDEASLRPVVDLKDAGELRDTSTRDLVSADWSPDAQILIRQAQPLPATITSVTMEVSIAE